MREEGGLGDALAEGKRSTHEREAREERRDRDRQKGERADKRRPQHTCNRKKIKRKFICQSIIRISVVLKATHVVPELRGHCSKL